MKTKGPTTPSSDGSSYIYLIVDTFSHYIVLHPLPRNDAVKALFVLFDHWTVKIGNPDILAYDNGNEYINREFKHFYRV